jgi:hypothetical protein
MSLREEMWKYEQITGESAEHVPIIKLGAFLDGYEMGLKVLEQQPKKGEWINAGEWSEGFGMGETYGWIYECSECGKQVKGGYPECNYNYCPYCGSDNRDLESLGESFADGYEDGLEEK